MQYCIGSSRGVFSSLVTPLSRPVSLDRRGGHKARAELKSFFTRVVLLFVRGLECWLLKAKRRLASGWPGLVNSSPLDHHFRVSPTDMVTQKRQRPCSAKRHGSRVAGCHAQTFRLLPRVESRSMKCFPCVFWWRVHICSPPARAPLKAPYLASRAVRALCAVRANSASRSLHQLLSESEFAYLHCRTPVRAFSVHDRPDVLFYTRYGFEHRLLARILVLRDSRVAVLSHVSCLADQHLLLNPQFNLLES